MQRVSVVGSSEAGKTTVGRALAEILGVPFTELHAVRHRPDWATIEPDEFTRRAEEVSQLDAWVVDGNYEAVVSDGPIWRRADIVVWLDVPKRVAMWQVTTRTLRRAVTREERSNILSWQPERSMMRWVWTTHGAVHDRYDRLAHDPAFGHLEFVRLRSRDRPLAGA